MNRLDEPALKLNKSWVPIAAEPLHRALSDVFKEKARIVDPIDFTLHTWESWVERPVLDGEPFIATTGGPIRVPEVIVLNQYNKTPRHGVPYNRQNVYKRDSFRCQYCGRKPANDDWSIDHVDPKSQGGVACWENSVTACTACNHKKANRTPEQAKMRLRRVTVDSSGKEHVSFYDRPKAPVWSPRYATSRKRPPESWKQFIDAALSDLYWETELVD